MADLPVINALNEGFQNQTNAFKDSISRLQRSIRQGLALNRAEIVNLNQTIMNAFNVNEEMLELEKERMRIDNERWLEQKRKEAQEKNKTTAGGGSGLGSGILTAAGILAGIGTAITAFTSALTVALISEGIKYQKMFNSAFAKAFRPIGKLFTMFQSDATKEVGGIRKAFRGFVVGATMQFTILADNAKELITALRTGVANFFGRIRAFGAMLTNQGQLFDDIARGFRAVVTPFINGINFVLEPLRTAVVGLSTAGETAKESVGVVQKIKDAITGFLTPFRAASSAFEPIIKIVKGLATTIGRVFFPLQIIIGAIDVVTETIAGFQEGGIVEGLKRGFTALLDATIFLIPNLLKDAVSFIADFFGFENVSKFLDQMSIGELVMEILSYPIKALGDVGSKIAEFFGLGASDEEKRIEEEKKALSSRRQEAELRKQKLEEIRQQALAEEQQALEESEKMKARLTAESADRSAQEISQEIDTIDRQLRENNRLRLEAQKFNASPEQMEALQAERDRLLQSRRDLRGAEIDARSRETAAQQASPSITVAAPQTNVSNQTQNVSRTSVAPASARRTARSPQNRDYQDPLWIG